MAFTDSCCISLLCELYGTAALHNVLHGFTVCAVCALFKRVVIGRTPAVSGPDGGGDESDL